jgi:hypothetical protein
MNGDDSFGEVQRIDDNGSSQNNTRIEKMSMGGSILDSNNDT